MRDLLDLISKFQDLSEKPALSGFKHTFFCIGKPREVRVGQFIQRSLQGIEARLDLGGRGSQGRGRRLW
jgi:hypothetical protein